MRLADWFLRRYDLWAAATLLKPEKKINEPDTIIQAGLGKKPVQRVRTAFLLMTLFLLILVSPLLGFPLWPFLAQWVYDLPFGEHNAFVHPVYLWYILPYRVISAMFAMVFVSLMLIWLWRKRLFDNLRRRLLPRMMGGILLGCVPLMSASDPWKWMLLISEWPAVALFVAMMLLSLLYLYVEARNTLEEGILSSIMHKESWIRVFHVFFIGLSQSLILGILLSEIFGASAVASLSDSLSKEGVVAVTGWIGYVFPKVILLYAPFALFLGILLQLFWEEKTVTHPL